MAQGQFSCLLSEQRVEATRVRVYENGGSRMMSHGGCMLVRCGHFIVGMRVIGFNYSNIIFI